VLWQAQAELRSSFHSRTGCATRSFSCTIPPVNRMRRPYTGSILLGLIPFVAICFTVPLWDRIDPTIFGLPFNFFWLIAWLVLTPFCMWGAYRLEARTDTDNHGGGD
jgi:hypothetical protein